MAYFGNLAHPKTATAFFAMQDIKTMRSNPLLLYTFSHWENGFRESKVTTAYIWQQLWRWPKKFSIWLSKVIIFVYKVLIDWCNYYSSWNDFSSWLFETFACSWCASLHFARLLLFFSLMAISIFSSHLWVFCLGSFSVIMRIIKYHHMMSLSHL